MSAMPRETLAAVPDAPTPPPHALPRRPRLSVVVATYNRLNLLLRLLEQLARQTLPPEHFEVVVVDDGSKEPVREPLAQRSFPFKLQVVVQKNAGAAAARHNGVRHASGEVVLITDDDMQVGEDFLARHLERHPEGSRNVVLGSIRPDPGITDFPLFERWYAWLNNRMAARLGGRRRPRVRGHNLYTGNVSFRREEYLRAGGFDSALGQSEDIELGVRLEKQGCRFEFCSEAYVLHGSDHTSLERWLRRAHRYGIFDSQVAAKHPDVPQVNPWRMLFDMNALARPLLAAAVVAPESTRPLTAALMEVVQRLDERKLERAAFAGTSVAYTMEYLRGARQHAGGLKGVLKQVVGYRAKVGALGQVARLLRTLKEDAVELTRAEHGEVSARALLSTVAGMDAWRILATQRLREAARGLRIPGVNHALRVAQTAVLGVELGKDVELGKGVYFVHGLGVVVGGDAKVGDRVRFYGNNTVGTAKDNGYPVIGNDVWVGAGARILGPITVGDRARIGANAVVLQDVPADSVAVGVPARIIIPRSGEQG